MLGDTISPSAQLSRPLRHRLGRSDTARREHGHSTPKGRCGEETSIAKLATMYLPVDFYTPLLYLAVVGILLVFSLPLGISAFFRRRKFLADAPGLQTYARRRDLRIQAGISMGLAVLAIAAGVTALIGWQQSMNNLVSNIQTRYAVTDVKITNWNGTWAQANLVSDDGVKHQDLSVYTGEFNVPILQSSMAGKDQQTAQELGINLR